MNKSLDNNCPKNAKSSLDDFLAEQLLGSELKAEYDALEDEFAEKQKEINKLKAQLLVSSHLEQAMDDIKLGRVQTAEEAFADILSEIENLDV